MGLVLLLVLVFWYLLSLSKDTDVGEPVFVTTLLNQGKYEEAQNLSKVTPDIGNITSYAGFFTIDNACESNFFFWFMPAQKGDWEKKPVVFWQQGGPGYSSVFGIFEEIGPFVHKKSSGLTRRQYSWNEENNLLIIDNPAGVGFSFSGKDCYPQNGTEVAEDLYLAFVQFYILFPHLRNNSLILSGESYAGHYLPAVGYVIHKNNPFAEVKINLSKFLIGGSWSDPLNQIDYGSLYFQHGLIDEETRDVFYEFQDKCAEEIGGVNFLEGVNYYCDALAGELFDTHVGPKVNIYNLLLPNDEGDQTWKDFIQSAEVRRRLHVGDYSFELDSNVVSESLQPDVYKSVKPFIEELLEYYPMVFITGQFDLIVPYVSVTNFLRSTKWTGQVDFIHANRSQWCSNKELVGYFKGSHLYNIMVRGAGHFISRDKPYLAYLIVNSVASGSPDNLLHLLDKCAQT